MVQEGMDEHIKKAYRESYNIDFIEFPKGDYGRANEMLDELVQLVNKRRETNPV